MSSRRVSGMSSHSRNLTPMSRESSSTVIQTKSFPIYIAINEYSRRMEDELDFKPGDKIQVITDDEEYNDGWYYGKNLRTQQEGLYPAVFTQEIKMERKYPLTRAKSTKRSVSNDSTTSLSQQNDSPTSLSNPITADIDNALEELKAMSHSSIDVNDITQETNISALDINPNPNPSSTSNLNPASASSWSPEEVTEYFISLGFEKKLASKFQQHKISGNILLELELSYLKELDIDSFGTRFEIFKEIEIIKEAVAALNNDTSSISNRSNKLMPPAHVDQSTPHKGHARKKSKTLNDIPTPSPSRQMEGRSIKNTNSSLNRPVSAILHGTPGQSTYDDLSVPKTVAEVVADKSSFVSPRRAPKPPSYPSPVQPPKSPLPYRNSSTDIATMTKSTPTITNTSNNYNNNNGSNTSRNLQNTISYSSSGNPPESLERTMSSNDSYSEMINKVSTRSTANKLRNMENISTASTSSSVYGEDSDYKKNGDGKSFKDTSFVLSPNKQHFTDNAAKSSPTGKTSSTPNLVSYSSPSKPPSSKNDSKAKEGNYANMRTVTPEETDDEKKRSVSNVMKGTTMKKMTSKAVTKKQTSAFMEGIRTITVQDAMKDADCSGWMNKKGSGTVGTWKTRFFTLHGTRLSYFGNTTDTRERGLIDITGHRVVPAREDDKLVSLFAASTGKGRYCFKLIPPQPGSKKGLTFTQPRVHYFAVDTKEEMRTWMTALIKTSIDIDTTVPIISSYSTPTISLSKAQEMLSEAREENRQREEQRQKESDEHRMMWDQQHQHGNNTNIKTDFDKPETLISGSTQLNSNTQEEELTASSSSNSSNVNTTTMSSAGFSSPYLLASGMSTPNIVRSNSMRAKERTPNGQQEDYFNQPTSKYMDDNKL
ncbi:hypothetical protein Kpol_1045p27 [Vanderwaltozyma polyspora DSM 70294]|uniref:Protein BOI2 n=1 Tax=Vanderwaltozyma polyspora (strain ATCC 22028 / DSM 70294 / BCRC 21397 / CBS 2163 / NBRC 10782 / NRRL Y-8283 / UCD 57-17) TaxID=436907 RepID=A7TI34_VANPO|nr:uncharacterized protein Kpol_1045p27 [Vanderwaltozyma polyspora DSM 70294]EDO18041.1 hypothetical protein Kpol_1045p27 [Vanderwaltozyma polyspora DSM 70294]